MGNFCCIRDKNSLHVPTKEEQDLDALFASNPPEIIIKTVDEANLLFEKNQEKSDLLLKFIFISPEEPYLFLKMISNFQYSHNYKKISFELGPFLSKETAELLLTALQDMNSLEVLELKLGENSNLDDNFITSLATLINNSICFNLKEFHLNISKAKITNVNNLIKAILDRESLERVILKLRQNNFNDEDFEIVGSILTKKSLKYLELDLHDNCGHEKAAQTFVKLIEENKTLQSAVFDFTNNRFTKTDKASLSEVVEKKKNVFTLKI